MRNSEPDFATKEKKDTYLEIIEKTNALETFDKLGRTKKKAPNSNELKLIQKL